MPETIAFEKLLRAFEAKLDHTFTAASVVPGEILSLTRNNGSAVVKVTLGRGVLAAIAGFDALLGAAVTLTVTEMAGDPQAHALRLDLDDYGDLRVSRQPRA
jgi:hypothetical protein